MRRHRPPPVAFCSCRARHEFDWSQPRRSRYAHPRPPFHKTSGGKKSCIHHLFFYPQIIIFFLPLRTSCQKKNYHLGLSLPSLFFLGVSDVNAPSSLFSFREKAHVFPSPRCDYGWPSPPSLLPPSSFLSLSPAMHGQCRKKKSRPSLPCLLASSGSCLSAPVGTRNNLPTPRQPGFSPTWAGSLLPISLSVLLTSAERENVVVLVAVPYVVGGLRSLTLPFLRAPAYLPPTYLPTYLGKKVPAWMGRHSPSCCCLFLPSSFFHCVLVFPLPADFSSSSFAWFESAMLLLSLSLSLSPVLFFAWRPSFSFLSPPSFPQEITGSNCRFATKKISSVFVFPCYFPIFPFWWKKTNTKLLG